MPASVFSVGRLAAAGQPQQREQLAVGAGETQVPDRLHRAGSLPEEPASIRMLRHSSARLERPARGAILLRYAAAARRSAARWPRARGRRPKPRPERRARDPSISSSSAGSSVTSAMMPRRANAPRFGIRGTRQDTNEGDLGGGGRLCVHGMITDVQRARRVHLQEPERPLEAPGMRLVLGDVLAAHDHIHQAAQRRSSQESSMRSRNLVDTIAVRRPRARRPRMVSAAPGYKQTSCAITRSACSPKCFA